MSQMKKQFNLTLFLISLVSFFLGRAVLFDSINPVALSFLACFCNTGTNIYSAFALTIIGLFTNTGGIYLTKYIISSVFILVFNIILKKRLSGFNILAKALASSASALIGGLIIAVLNSFSLYYTVIAALEAILTFSLTIVFNKGINFLLNRSGRLIASPEEIISLSLIASSIIAGSSDIFLGNISVTYALAVALALFISYSCGITVGATSSLLTGLLLIVSCDTPSEIAVVLAVSSAVSAAVRKKSKFISSVFFLFTAALLLLLLKNSLLELSLLYSALIGIGIFAAIPLSASKIFESSTSSNITTAEEYISRLKEITNHRLNSFSSSFRKLAKTFSVLSEKKSALDKNDVSRLIDDISDRTCKSCDLKHFCWEKNFYKTYQTIFAVLNSLESFGYLTKENLPVDFIRDCIRPQEFIENTNKLYEIYKTNLLWENKIIESRELVSQQLRGVSNIIDALSKDLDFDLTFKENISNAVKYTLNNKGIDILSATATENKSEKLELIIRHRYCGGEKLCTSKILPAINKSLNKKMSKSCCECILSKNNICTLRLTEAKKFHISTAVSRSSKTVGKLSGDSYSFMPMPDGKYLLLLSDGMGSGIKAHEESAASIDLFEDFMSAGFDRKTAIDIINSVLVLKSTNDNFSTMDICTIDLYTGTAEFVKIGAATTYILRSGMVDIIKSSSLPIGILNSIELETRKRKLKSGDFVIMVTDGITDAFSSATEEDNPIIGLLEKYHGSNPVELADYIINTAKEINSEINDDMTVLTARIWESA